MLTALRFGGGVALNGHRTATFDLKGQPARSPDFFIEQLPHVYVAALQSQKSAFFLPGFKQHHLVHLARNKPKHTPTGTVLCGQTVAHSRKTSNLSGKVSMLIVTSVGQLRLTWGILDG